MSEIAIKVRAPFPWRQSLEYLGWRATPRLETIEGDTWVRQVHDGIVTVRHDGRSRRLVASGAVDADTAERIARLFRVDYDARAATAHLARDPLLAPRLAAVPGLRPLSAWSPFELGVRTIIGQQVTVAGARTLMARLVDRVTPFEPAVLAAANLDAIGMPGARVAAIRAFAAAVASGAIEFERPWPELDSALAKLPGMGPWTRGYLGIRLGRDDDAFPESDLGLIRAAGVENPKAMLARAERWRPFRGVAATYLWAVAAPSPEAARE